MGVKCLICERNIGDLKERVPIHDPINIVAAHGEKYLDLNAKLVSSCIQVSSSGSGAVGSISYGVAKCMQVSRGLATTKGTALGASKATGKILGAAGAVISVGIGIADLLT